MANETTLPILSVNGFGPLSPGQVCYLFIFLYIILIFLFFFLPFLINY